MSKKILLADDDASIRTMVGRVLESENYHVICARTGREAVEDFVAATPDLVLLDLNMPDKDGWEAWQMMSAIHPFVPVIVITARPLQHEHARRMRIDALMEKPLDLAVLLAAIKTLLGQPRQERLQRATDPNFSTVLLNEPTNL